MIKKIKLFKKILMILLILMIILILLILKMILMKINKKQFINKKMISKVISKVLKIASYQLLQLMKTSKLFLVQREIKIKILARLQTNFNSLYFKSVKVK